MTRLSKLLTMKARASDCSTLAASSLTGLTAHLTHCRSWLCVKLPVGCKSSRLLTVNERIGGNWLKPLLTRPVSRVAQVHKHALGARSQEDLCVSSTSTLKFIGKGTPLAALPVGFLPVVGGTRARSIPNFSAIRTEARHDGAPPE